MKIRVDTTLKTFEGDALKADLSLADLVNTLNAVLAAVASENEELGTRMNALAESMVASKKKDLTLRGVLFLLSSSPLPKATASDRETIFGVAVAAMGKDEIDLSAEQIVVLKKEIGELFTAPLVQRQAALLLEGIDPFAAGA